MAPPVPVRRIRMLAIPVLLSTLAFAGGSARAEDTALVITTDTTAYCGQLHDSLEAMLRAATVAPPRQVTELSVEGERMCNHGLPRGGILRLRRALSIMTHGGDDP